MPRDERGTALVLALAIIAILGVLASVVAITAHTETLIASRVEQARGLQYAADGALSLALADLARAEWTDALTGAPSTFREGDSSIFCCGAGTLTDSVQQVANFGRTWAADTPRWRLYLWGPVSAWLDAAEIPAPFQVVVWIADDPADGDGNPDADANAVLGVCAAALGPSGGRRGVRALVERPRDEAGIPAKTGIRILSWQETQW